MKALQCVHGLQRTAPRLNLSRRWSLRASSAIIFESRIPRTLPRPRCGGAATASHTAYSTQRELPHRNSLDSIGSVTVDPALTACPGCGALAQTVQPGEPGYFSLSRRTVAKFVKSHDIDPRVPESSGHDEEGAAAQLDSKAPSKGMPLPHCDRCHDLLHHSKGMSILHPSMQSIEDTIAESPYKYNHIYHIVDAADFPMSLIRSIHRTLSLAPQRSKNRRAKHAGIKKGKKTEMSFIITRSDLLAPTKEQVDKLMPYMVQVLRDALGSRGEDVRLGNVRCVSAKRGWWTKNVKADIWLRGGAGWLVGKVNVGKSNLFEVVFPKGGEDSINIASLRDSARALQAPVEPHSEDVESSSHWLDAQPNAQPPGDEDDENSLLPPARPEEPFPLMPTVSSLPGTTASPIRIPFGGGKGELIDLPGLSRSDLENFIRPEARQDLIMRARVSPEQYSIKDGQSLLLGGLVRITPRRENLTILACPFVPIKPHLTSTLKAVEMEQGQRQPMMETVVTPGALASVRSAGRFQLRWDVTKQRAGPLVAKSAVGLKPQQLAFKVLSVDILIESVGWVELVCQVRRSDFPDHLSSHDNVDFPEVDIFTPEGRFIAYRRPMGAWMLSKKALIPSSRKSVRPRRSMAGVKKASKIGGRRGTA